MSVYSECSPQSLFNENFAKTEVSNNESAHSIWVKFREKDWPFILNLLHWTTNYTANYAFQFLNLQTGFNTVNFLFADVRSNNKSFIHSGLIDYVYKYKYYAVMDPLESALPSFFLENRCFKIYEFQIDRFKFHSWKFVNNILPMKADFHAEQMYRQVK